ncbi:LOW QUALITY PROTEIN: hypothetical protein PHMEG_00025663 [Phytophthora megakarya]|uniref:Uncharacterized protein n=1 Tax=Phytophthora megakarya TaxID=4795 RepID=A0A225VCR6_9STRA|nr:LOW QUALITY PROTEIN: hypothetical protein PHMEG_00025663 [Phytophthora megakarya]
MRDSEVPSLDMTVFRRNIPATSQMRPVLGRSSLRYWNISVSLPKSEFGKLTIPSLSHGVSVDGIRALSKIIKGIEDLPFPSTYKGVQSFLGSLNYYNKFIEDLPVVAAVLYELDEERIVSTPLLRHPDRAKPFVIIPHANPWAACAVLGQEHEGLIHPVRFTDRALKEPALRYHLAEKEVLPILRTLETLIHGSEFPVVVYTRYSVLKWLLESNTADGRHLKWGLELSRWTLEIHRTQKDEDGLAAILGSGITPRENLDKVAETLIPAKGCLKMMPQMSLQMLEAEYQGYVLTFDDATKAEGHILEGVTVNDAEYHGLILGLKFAMKYDVKELVAVGDSQIVVQQAQGLINCNQSNLQRRLAEHEDLRKNFVSVKLIHVKREFNQAADYLTSKTLVLGESWELDDPDEIGHLRLVSRIPEKIMKPSEISGTPATDVVCSDQVEFRTDNPCGIAPPSFP